MNTFFFNSFRPGVLAQKLIGLALLTSASYLPTACRQESAVVTPIAAKGTLLVTAAPAFFSLFTERIDIVVYLNDKKVGTLTRGFVYMSGQTSPECNAQTSGAVLRVEAEAGTYTLRSEGIRPNQPVLNGTRKSVTIAADQCQHLVTAPIPITL